MGCDCNDHDFENSKSRRNGRAVKEDNDKCFKYGSYNKNGNYDCILNNNYGFLYKSVIGESDILKIEEGVVVRAKEMAALRRLCSIDYENGTWL